MYILGINAYHGDASAAILKDGILLAAAEEERFNRKKHTAGFPAAAVRFCLEEAGIGPSELDHVAIGRDPSANLLDKVLYTLGRGFSIARTVRDRMANAAKVRDLRSDLSAALGCDPGVFRARFHNVEHHLAHLASCFFVSPFDDAAICSLDGFGDFISTKWGTGKGNRISVDGQVGYPHSMGILYLATTQYLGFPHYGDEGKVMGLAPYGKPKYLPEFRDMVRLLKDGEFELNLDYFLHHREGISMSWDEGQPVVGRVWSDKFTEKLGAPREPKSAYDERVHDIASSLQAMLEEVYFHVVNALFERTKNPRLCLAGGVALNSVANGMLFDRSKFTDVFIQPAAGDNGISLGSAYYVWHQVLDKPRGFVMRHAYTGPEYDDARIAKAVGEKLSLDAGRVEGVRTGTVEPIVVETKHWIVASGAEEPVGVRVSYLAGDKLYDATVDEMLKGDVIGWFQGRMEFGPRALGNRSIVVDPRRTDMKDILNSRIKHREAFRPFAPSILEEATGDYFERSYPSPTMLMVYKIRPEKRDVIPAVNHVDDTGRLQTVRREDNERYWKLIKTFGDRTGVPVILNTSFNENEPIVNTPEEALNCFLKTQMDVMVMGNWFLRKQKIGAGVENPAEAKASASA